MVRIGRNKTKPQRRSCPNSRVETEPRRRRTSDTIVIVCSGPSIDECPLWTKWTPYQWCAISTAIRFVTKPEYWCFVDRVNRKHGEYGFMALDDPRICKITSANRYPLYCDKPGMVFIPMNGTHEDEGRTFMDGKGGYLRGAKRSILHAVQYFCEEGFTQLIFAGCDLKTTLDAPYCHDLKMDKESVPLQNAGHAETLECLRAWSVIAKQRGIAFQSITPGSPINEFMETLL